MARKSGCESVTLTDTQRAIQEAAALFRRARNGLALTGAGISTPSGIPDFRSPDSGLWTRHNPFEVASLSAFRYAPEKFYNWIRPLASLILQAQPNPAHLGLARLEASGHIRTIVTQNIDGLHQKAGSSRVLEVHGTMDYLTCVSCYEQVGSENVADRFLETGEVPRCGSCGGVLKPDVILFEEQLPQQIWRRAEEACRQCDLMVIAGSSLEVTPVAGLPMRAVERRIPLIVVNLLPTYVDVRADVIIHANVAEIIPLIVEEIFRA